MSFCFQCRDNFETTREEAKSLMEKMLEVRGPVIICCQAFFPLFVHIFLIDIVSMPVVAGAKLFAVVMLCCVLLYPKYLWQLCRNVCLYKW